MQSLAFFARGFWGLENAKGIHSNATRTVNLDLPAWAIVELDREAVRRASPCQLLMKGLLIECLEALREKKAL